MFWDKGELKTGCQPEIEYPVKNQNGAIKLAHGGVMSRAGKTTAWLKKQRLDLMVVQWFMWLIVMRIHARIAKMVKVSSMVDHTKGNIVARKMVKMIQYSPTQSLRGCLGSVTRRKRMILLIARLG